MFSCKIFNIQKLKITDPYLKSCRYYLELPSAVGIAFVFSLQYGKTTSAAVTWIIAGRPSLGFGSYLSFYRRCRKCMPALLDGLQYSSTGMKARQTRKRGRWRENMRLGLLLVGLFALCFSWCGAWWKIMKNCFTSRAPLSTYISSYLYITFKILRSVNAHVATIRAINDWTCHEHVIWNFYRQK